MYWKEILILTIFAALFFIGQPFLVNTTEKDQGLCASREFCTRNMEIKKYCAELLARFPGDNKKTNWTRKYVPFEHFFKKHEIRKSVEIGVAYGGFSLFLLSRLPNLIHYGVDPFVGQYDDAHDAMSIKLAEFRNKTGSDDLWARAVLTELAPFGCRFRLFHDYSTKVAPLFPRHSLDLVYVDGDHTYEGCHRDIVAWYGIVKTGGIMVFDDYSDLFPGVIKAVDEFAARHGFQVLHVPDWLDNVYVVLTHHNKGSAAEAVVVSSSNVTAVVAAVNQTSRL